MMTLLVLGVLVQDRGCSQASCNTSVRAATLGERSEAAPARLFITCPVDATLWIDDYAVKQTGPRRGLITPPLATQTPSQYTLRLTREEVELARKEIAITGGQTLEVTLEPTVAANFGLHMPALPKPSTQKATRGGQPISLAEAARLLNDRAVGQALPKNADSPRLTLIGTPEDCQRVAEQLAGPFRDLATGFILKQYRPTDWAVRLAGFKTDGQPTIYAQDAAGKVLFRQDEPTALRLNLEAVRKPQPNYRPENDPDYRRAPAPPAPEPPPEAELPVAAISLVLAAAIALWGWLRG